MNILFVLCLSCSLPGIASTRVEFLAKYFTNAGNNVSVSCIFDPTKGEKPNSKLWLGIRMFNYIPLMLRLNALTIVLNLLSLLFTSWIPFAITRPDVVIISVPPGESAIFAYILAKLFRAKKIIFDYRDEWEDYAISASNSVFLKMIYRLLKYLMTICYRNSDLVITVTEGVSTKLTDRGVKNNTVITNGADISIFKPNFQNKRNLRAKIGLKDNDFVLIHSGLLGEYYRIEIVLESLRLLLPKIPKLKFVIVGMGPDLERILSLAKTLELQDTVLYLGKKSERKDIADIISTADLGVIAFKADDHILSNALPVKAFEYLACGIPIIATTSKSSLLGKLIEEHGVGMICDPERTDKLAETIEKVYLDSNFMNLAQSKAIKLIEERFDAQKLSQKFLNSITNN